MISSILVSERNERGLYRGLYISLFCTLFCVVFYMVYNHFSHGVHSPFMTYLFAWPLILCELPCVLFLIVPVIPGPSLLSSLVWCTGAAAAAVSSLLRGVFEIAGNSSVYQAVMMYAGFLFLLCGFILYIAGIRLLAKEK